MKMRMPTGFWTLCTLIAIAAVIAILFGVPR
jgi:hypothetical protein